MISAKLCELCDELESVAPWALGTIKEAARELERAEGRISALREALKLLANGQPPYPQALASVALFADDDVDLQPLDAAVTATMELLGFARKEP